MKDGAYIINEYFDSGTHWTTLCELNNNVTDFESFEVEHIAKEIKKFIDKSTVVTNIFRIQEYNSILCSIFVLDLLILCLKAKA